MTEKKRKQEVIVAVDPNAARMIADMEKAEKDGVDTTPADVGMLSLILKSLNKVKEDEVRRMAFELDPLSNTGGYAALYRVKIGLVPDHIIKKICGPSGDELVCQILQARSNHLASFGRPRTSRFSPGFEFEEMNKDLIPDDENAYNAQQTEINKAKDVMWNCGYKGLQEDWHPNLAQFLKMITRDGIAYGRFAVEFIYQVDPKSGTKKIHSFRAVDAGTIYRIMPNREMDKSTRTRALQMLQDLKNSKFDVNKYKEDKYKWVQVIDGRPVQAFTEEELVVYNLYPATNVEYNGYPLTPIDQAINAITTHINITIHNKLYFQNGRAAKGILIFQSDNIDETTVQKIRLQYHQSINSVANSWRMPVFGIGAEEKIDFKQIEVQGRDAEFQYLMDSNARVILSAFQMSPEELPGYAHLSRGTNTQALAEADNEWKLTAARDVGLRPLMCDIQDFVNAHILPKFFESISKSHQLTFYGLDKDSPEKEATRLQQDMPLHMTYDEILEKVEKEKLGLEKGGQFPLNPQFQQVAQTYLTFGEILENFFGRKGAATDPRYNFYMNPMWMQWQQVLMQKAQMAMQQQMANMQASMGVAPGQSGEGGNEGGDKNEEGEEGEKGGQEAPPTPPQKPTSSGDKEEDAKKMEQYNRDMSQYFMKSTEYLNKAISSNHNAITKMIMKRHKEVSAQKMKDWADNTSKALARIKSSVKGNE